jgi:hypothetical protein
MTTFAIATNIRQSRPATRRRDTDLQAAINAGYANLARAMVQAAIKDALRARDELTREEAAAWLGSDDGLEIAELSGFDTKLIKKWYFAGCPAKTERIQ